MTDRCINLIFVPFVISTPAITTTQILDYYVPYTGSFLVGERKVLEFGRADDSNTVSVLDYRNLTSDVDAARDSAFDDFCQALKEVPWIQIVRGENACMEFTEEYKKSNDLLCAFGGGGGLDTSRLTSCLVVFDAKDEPMCLKMLEELRQDMDIGFFLYRNFVYVPHEGKASYETDEYLYFLEISLRFYEDLTNRALRNKLNLYLTESSCRIREFIRRNRKQLINKKL